MGRNKTTSGRAGKPLPADREADSATSPEDNIRQVVLLLRPVFRRLNEADEILKTTSGNEGRSDNQTERKEDGTTSERGA